MIQLTPFEAAKKKLLQLTPTNGHKLNVLLKTNYGSFCSSKINIYGIICSSLLSQLFVFTHFIVGCTRFIIAKLLSTYY